MKKSQVTSVYYILLSIAFTGAFSVINFCLADGIDQPYKMPLIIQSPLLSSEKIVEVASQCRHEISQAHRLQSQIPLHNRREHAIALGIASDKCESLIKSFEALKQATHDYPEFQKNIQRAQAGTLDSNYNNNFNEHNYAPLNTDNNHMPTILDMSLSESNNFGPSQHNQIIEEELSSYAEPTSSH